MTRAACIETDPSSKRHVASYVSVSTVNIYLDIAWQQWQCYRAATHWGRLGVIYEGSPWEGFQYHYTVTIFNVAIEGVRIRNWIYWKITIRDYNWKYNFVNLHSVQFTATYT